MLPRPTRARHQRRAREQESGDGVLLISPSQQHKGAKVFFVLFWFFFVLCAWVFPGIAARRDPILGIGQPIVPKSASIAHVAFDNVFRTVNHRSICVTCRLLIATESGGKVPKRTENQKNQKRKIMRQTPTKQGSEMETNEQSG